MVFSLVFLGNSGYCFVKFFVHVNVFPELGIIIYIFILFN